MAKKKRAKSSGKKKRGKSHAKRAASAVKNIFSSQRGAAAAPPRAIVMHGVQKVVTGVEGFAAAKATQFAISHLPIKNPMAKAGLQTAIGFLTGLFTDSRPWLRGLSDSNYHLGIAGLARSRGVETMAGEEDYHLVVDNQGNVHEMTGAQLEEMQGNLNGNLNGDDDEEAGVSGGYAMQGNMDEEGSMEGGSFQM